MVQRAFSTKYCLVFIARLGLCLINYLTSKQRYIMSHSVPVISIQHTLIFINLQEEMLLETNRDLKRKVVPSKSSNTRNIIHLRSLDYNVVLTLSLSISVGGKRCNAYSIAMWSFFFCRTFPTTTTATTRHELLSNKPSKPRSRFLQAFTRQCSMADEVFIIE